MLSLMAARPAITLTGANIVVDGNSLTADTPSWANLLIGLPPFSTNGSTLTNFAVGAQTTANMLADSAAQVDPAIASGRPNILIAFEIINDLYFGTTVAKALQNIESYCNGRRKAGYKVIVIGPLPTTRANLSDDLPTTQVKLVQVENWLNANWKGMADGYLNPRTVPGLESWSSTYFYDTVHLNDAGDALLAGALVPVIQGLKI